MSNKPRERGAPSARAKIRGRGSRRVFVQLAETQSERADEAYTLFHPRGMGGDLTVTSTPGVGSEFTLRLQTTPTGS